MLEQRIRNRQPNALQGALLIAAVAVVVILVSNFFYGLEARIGTLASIGFLTFGCVVAYGLLDWFVLGFVYTSNLDCLRVCRFYGKRERFIVDIWFNAVVGYGTPEEVKQRFPGARFSRATKRQCPHPPFALAYRSDGKLRALVIQPDEAMKAHIVECLKKRK